jgi:5-methylthioadenosine/S-adenosylhomocysteine deaminase
MDLFEEMKLAALLNKVAADDPSVFTASEVLRMATLDGARALGLDHLVGSLEVGKRADLIAVGLRGVRVQPWHDDAASLVYAVRGSDVTSVWINGEQLVADGRPTRLDPEAIATRARAAASRVSHALV